MKINKTPSQETLKKYFTYNSKSGSIVRKIRTSNRIQVGDEAGYCHRGYLYLEFQGKKYYAHRIAWKIFNGDFDESKEIDHINGKTSDNRIKNLRLVDRKEQMRNLRKRKDNTSGVTGVRFHTLTKKWHARFWLNKKEVNLGYFKTKKEAVEMREKHEAQHSYHKNHGVNK